MAGGGPLREALGPELAALRRARSRLRSGLRGVDRRHGLLLGAVVAAAAVVRLVPMGEPMRYDEAFTFLNYSITPLHHITTDYTFPNNHVLYSVLTHCSWRLFGDHLWTVRLPALVAGIALVPATYGAARALYDREAALWAAALTAGFAPFVDFSVAGRGYTLGLLLTVGLLWIGARLLDRSGRWRWRAWVACAVLAFYDLPTSAFAVATVGLWMAASALLRRPRDWRMPVRLGVALAASAALSVLLYWAMLHQPGWTFVKSLPRGRLDDLADGVWKFWNRGAPHPFDWLLVAGFVVSIVAHRRIARHAVHIAAPAVVVVAGVVLVGKIPPFARSWLYLAPFYVVPAGAGLAYAVRALGSPRLGAARTAVASAALAVLCGGALAAGVLHDGQGHAEEPPESANGIAAFLRSHMRPGERALVEQLFAGPAIDYYLHRDGFDGRSLSITPAQRAAGHVLVVVPGHDPGAAAGLVRATGGAVPPGSPPPRLVRRFRYIAVFDVALARRAGG